jgi:hypothetical protein
MLPIKLILQEYLSNDYIRDVEENIGENMSENQYTNMGNLIKRDLYSKDDKVINVFDDGLKHSTIVESTEYVNLEENMIPMGFMFFILSMLLFFVDTTS